MNSCKAAAVDLAVTWAPLVATDRTRFVPSQVTICPWLFQYARSKLILVSVAGSMMFRVLTGFTAMDRASPEVSHGYGSDLVDNVGIPFHAYRYDYSSR